jgi:hypothetical protein
MPCRLWELFMASGRDGEDQRHADSVPILPMGLRLLVWARAQVLPAGAATSCSSPSRLCVPSANWLAPRKNAPAGNGLPGRILARSWRHHHGGAFLFIDFPAQTHAKKHPRHVGQGMPGTGEKHDWKSIAHPARTNGRSVHRGHRTEPGPRRPMPSSTLPTTWVGPTSATARARCIRRLILIVSPPMAST